MHPTQGCNRAVREAEFHIAPLLVKVPRPLQCFLVDLQENDSLGREDISSQLNREFVIPCSGSTISDRLIQHVIRSVQLGVFRVVLGDFLEGFEHGQMVVISLVVVGHNWPRVEEEFQRLLAVQSLVNFSGSPLCTLSPVLGLAST